jgi:hypothetical protein
MRQDVALPVSDFDLPDFLSGAGLSPLFCRAWTPQNVGKTAEGKKIV